MRQFIGVLGRVSGLLLAVAALSACAVEDGEETSNSAGQSLSNEFEREDGESGEGGEGAEDRCEALLDRLDQTDSEEEFEDLLDAYNECVEDTEAAEDEDHDHDHDHGHEGQDPGCEEPLPPDALDVCEAILFELDYAQTQEEVERIHDAYNQCLVDVGLLAPEDPCAPILEGLGYVQTEEEADQILREYDACWAGMYPQPEDPCAPILERLDHVQTEEEADDVIAAYEACWADLSMERAPLACEAAAVGLLGAQSPEEALQFAGEFAACVPWDDSPTLTICAQEFESVMAETEEEALALVQRWGECVRRTAEETGEPCVGLLGALGGSQSEEEDAWILHEFAVCREEVQDAEAPDDGERR